MASGSRKRRVCNDVQPTRKRLRLAERYSETPVEVIDISSSSDGDGSDDARCVALRTLGVRDSESSPVAVHPSATVAASDEPADLPYEVCFGLLLMETTCRKRYNDVPESAPVQIIRFGNILKLQYEGTGEPAGILNSKALAQLMRDHSVTLRAFLGAHDEKRSSTLGIVSDVWVRPPQSRRLRFHVGEGHRGRRPC
ncbi:hypothetical protein VTI74DRAFT_6341 [Chaetomium olivicolor]